MKLSRLKPEQQKEAALLLVSGQIQSVDEYENTQQAPPGESSPTESTEHEDEDEDEDHDQDQDQDQDEDQEPRHSLSSPPFSLPVSESSVFQGIISDLKNEARDCSCTPDSFLAEFTALAHQIQKDIAWYSTSYYEAVYPLLTREHLSQSVSKPNGAA